MLNILCSSGRSFPLCKEYSKELLTLNSDMIFTVFLVVSFQAFSVTEQLRTHCSTEISELERIVGSQQELLAALAQTYPEQVTESSTV